MELEDGSSAIVSAPANSARSAAEGAETDVANMLKNMQKQFARTKDEAKQQTVGEAKTEDIDHKKIKAAAKPKAKGKAKAKAKAKIVTSGPTPKDNKVLKFDSLKYRAPRHYGGCTIYTDCNKECWRLKLKPGDKHEKYYQFGDKPQATWARMVADLKKVA